MYFEIFAKAKRIILVICGFLVFTILGIVFFAEATKTNSFHATELDKVSNQFTGTLITADPCDNVPSGHIRLVNRYFDCIVIEARRGNNNDVNRNQSLGSRTLHKNERWDIKHNNQGIWYRRKECDRGGWGVWTRWTPANATDTWCDDTP